MSECTIVLLYYLYSRLSFEVVVLNIQYASRRFCAGIARYVAEQVIDEGVC